MTASAYAAVAHANQMGAQLDHTERRRANFLWCCPPPATSAGTPSKAACASAGDLQQPGRATVDFDTFVWGQLWVQEVAQEGVL